MLKSHYYLFCLKFILAIFIYITIGTSFSYSQISCGTDGAPAGYQTKSTPCIDMDIDEVPIKTVRVSFHIFQKDDGSENIQNDSAGNDYLDAIEWSMNHFMSNLPMFDYTTSSPYYTDSKIRYEVVATHFWQNTEMWSKGDDKTISRGNSLYNFIMGKSIPFKNTSVHLFMPGNFSGIEKEFGGVACDYQCNQWSTTIGVYYKYINSDPTNRNHWDPGKTFCHELGHNFGLYHTFVGDNCSDTPPLCKKCTNNMMDYEEVASLTQCQLSKMHKWLETYTSIVKSGLPNYTMSGQITWSGGSASLLPVLNNVPDPQITVDINAPGTTNFSWTYVNGNGN